MTKFITPKIRYTENPLKISIPENMLPSSVNGVAEVVALFEPEPPSFGGIAEVTVLFEPWVSHERDKEDIYLSVGLSLTGVALTAVNALSCLYSFSVMTPNL